MAEDYTLAREAIDKGASSFFTKPLSHLNIIFLWQNISRVTRRLPGAAFNNTTNTDIQKICSFSSSSSASRKHKLRNDLKLKTITTDEENRKRRKNHIAQDLNSTCDADEYADHFHRKSRMTWTSSLHAKFLQAIYRLGDKANGDTILHTMQEPGLTYRQVSSHLQKYRERVRRSFNPSKRTRPVMPVLLPRTPLSNFIEGQTSAAPNINCTATHATPQTLSYPSWSNAAYYSIDDVQQKLDELNRNTLNGTTGNVIINNGSMDQVAQGNGRDQIATEGGQVTLTNGQVASAIQAPIQEAAGDLGLEYFGNGNTRNLDNMYNDNFGEGTLTNAQVASATQAPNHEAAGDWGIGLFGNGNMRNLGNMNNDNFGGLFGNGNTRNLGIMNNGNFGERTLTNGQVASAIQAPNREAAGDLGIGLHGNGNTCNLGNMNNDNLGEGTSGQNQQFSADDGMPTDIDVTQILQDLEEAGINLWDTN